MNSEKEFKYYQTSYGSLCFRHIWENPTYLERLKYLSYPFHTGYGATPGTETYNLFRDLLWDWKSSVNQTLPSVPGRTFNFYQTVSDAISITMGEFDEVYTIAGNYIGSRGRLACRGFRKSFVPKDQEYVLPSIYGEPSKQTKKACTIIKKRKVKRLLLEPIYRGLMISPDVVECLVDNGVRLHVDEALTGFGRCGEFWGIDYYPELLHQVRSIFFGKASRLCGAWTGISQTATEDYSPHALIQSLNVLETIMRQGIVERNKKIGEYLCSLPRVFGKGLFIFLGIGGIRYLPFYDITKEELADLYWRLGGN